MANKRKEIDKNGPFQTRFKELYDRHYMPQEKFADLVGTCRQTVASWLNGKSVPDIMSLTKIAQVFQVSSDYLLGLSDTI